MPSDRKAATALTEAGRRRRARTMQRALAFISRGSSTATTASSPRASWIVAEKRGRKATPSSAETKRMNRVMESVSTGGARVRPLSLAARARSWRMPCRSERSAGGVAQELGEPDRALSRQRREGRHDGGERLAADRDRAGAGHEDGVVGERDVDLAERHHVDEPVGPRDADVAAQG